MVKGEELKAVDKVMLQLIDDLKERVGLELSTYCFDIGVLRDDITPDSVSKKDYVFYEYQIPFGLTGYMNSVELQDIKSDVLKLLWNSIQRAWIHRKKQAEEAEQATFVSSEG